MGRYRKVDTRIWNDAKFMSMSDSGQLAFLFVLTHPSMTSIGAMKASLAGLAEEKGWTAEAFGKAFGEALSKGMAKHDPRACFIWLPNFLRYNKPENPNVVVSWAAQWDLLPECDMLEEARSRAVTEVKALGEAFTKALPEVFLKSLRKASAKDIGKGMPKPDPDPDPDPDPQNYHANVSPKQRSKPANSTLESTIAHFEERYLDKRGEPNSTPTTKLRTWLKTTLVKFDPADVTRRIDYYFQSTEKFIADNSYSPNIFITKFGALKDGPLTSNGSQNTYDGIPTGTEGLD